MLFNSQVFMIVFLPIVLASYWLSLGWRLHGGALQKAILLGASWIFYAYMDVRLFPLLLFSILINFFLVRTILRRNKWSKPAVIFGIAVNLALLGFFKYLDFFANIFTSALGWAEPEFNIALPLAISFFTFQQISCLVDEYNGQETPHSFLDYALFISFFPQLIAGPIVRHHQLIPQIQSLPILSNQAEKIVSGIILITIGMIKKVAIADTLATMTNPIFNASLSQPISASTALAAISGFSAQIYYDFSGYSDIAIGLALLFGIVLPINFNAPFQAASLIEFWRRWHITLSTFLRDYLYIPLGGSRNGVVVMLLALMATMLLGGLWHGAAWNFVVWGGLHGVGLAVNHMWKRTGIQMPTLLGWALTLLFVVLTFAVFRTETLTSFGNLFGWFSYETASAELFSFKISGDVYAALIVGWAVALFGLTSQSLCEKPLLRRPQFAPVLAVCLIALVLHIGGQPDQEFIYFQF